MDLFNAVDGGAGGVLCDGLSKADGFLPCRETVRLLSRNRKCMRHGLITDAPKPDVFVTEKDRLRA